MPSGCPGRARTTCSASWGACAPWTRPFRSSSRTIGSRRDDARIAPLEDPDDRRRDLRGPRADPGDGRHAKLAESRMTEGQETLARTESQAAEEPAAAEVALDSPDGAGIVTATPDDWADAPEATD